VDSFVPLLLLALLYVAFVFFKGYFEGQSPYVMEYHRDLLPSQVGIVNAVYFEKKRFDSLDESIAFAKRLISQGYKFINVNVSRGAGSYRVELDENQPPSGPRHFRVTVVGDVGMTTAELTVALTP